MNRSSLQRDSLRRSGGGSGSGVTSITINGGGSITGAIALLSPMLSQVGNTVRIDNANVVALTDAALIVGVTADIKTEFSVTLGGNRTVGIPTGPVNAEKITFLITQDVVGGRTAAWTGGAGGYRFANAASAQGVKLADFNNLLASCPASGSVRVGFEYFTTSNTWDCVALAGYWP